MALFEGPRRSEAGYAQGPRQESSRREVGKEGSMIYEIIRIKQWPKWFDVRCAKCGEMVPMGHGHVCDKGVPAAARKGKV